MARLQMPHGFDFQGVYVYPSPDRPRLYFVLPTRPEPETRPDGKPTLMFIQSGGAGFLQLGVRLALPDATLAALRAHLAARDDVPPESILLASAPLRVRTVQLLLGDGAGGFVEVARRESSGQVPYTTLFHLQVNASQGARVAGALNGRADLVRIRYDAVVSVTAKATATIHGDLGVVLRSPLATGPETVSEAWARRALERALADGQLTLTVSSEGGASAGLAERAVAMVKGQAVVMLVRLRASEGPRPDPARAGVTAALTEPIEIALEFTTDVGTWFDEEGGSGLAHIVSAGSSGTSTESTR